MKRILGMIVIALVLIVTFGLLEGDVGTRAAGPHIDLYFMTAAQGTGSPAKWCTGSFNPPIHQSDRAIDVFGDGSGSTCLGSNSSTSDLRSWGFGGTVDHQTMGAWASGGAVVGGCDIVKIGMIDVLGGLHGELQDIHTSRTISTSTQMKLWAGPGNGEQRVFAIGNTTEDDDGCAWVGYHVHQGTLLDCMTVNAALQSTTQYSIWHPYFYISEIDYEEGLNGCDG